MPLIFEETKCLMILPTSNLNKDHVNKLRFPVSEKTNGIQSSK